MTQKDIENNNTLPHPTSWSKWPKRIFILLFILVIVTVLALRTSYVQSYILNYLTQRISEKTNTNISATEIQFSIFEGVILKDLCIIDTKTRDTIIYGGNLHLSLRKNMLSIFNNSVDLSYIGLKDIELNIITEIGEFQSSLDRFLSGLSNSENTGDKSLWDINLKSLDLSNIDIFIHDKNKGKWQKVFIEGGSVEINNLDILCNEYDIESIILSSPIYQQHIYDENCKITDDINLPAPNSSKSKQPFTGFLKELIIKDGGFGMSNSQLAKIKSEKKYLDYNNFSFDDIQMYFKNIEIFDDFFLNAQLETLQTRDNTGFEIKNISADTISINREMIELKSFVVSAGKTQVRDHLMLSFENWNSFKNFGHEVYFNADLRSTEVYLGDIAHFAQGLYKLKFVNDNVNEKIIVNGKYSGYINNLGGRDVEISMGNKLNLKGIFNSRDLLDSDKTLLNVRLDNLTTSMNRIKQVFPKFNIPLNFYKLGQINFKGRFDGFLEDFVAYGTLKTDLGMAEMDMSLNITQGTEKSRYSGNLNLKGFNLGQWSDNKDFGLVSFSAKVSEGIGFTLNSVKAILDANISSFDFKKYNYRNIELNGKINKNTFDGFLVSKDVNFDLEFEGNLEYYADQSFLNFEADIKNIDLKAVHWAKDSTVFSGLIKTNVSGSNLNDFIGDIELGDLTLFYKDTSYTMQDLLVSSKINTDKNKVLTLKSDIGSGSIIGQYDFNNLVPSLQRVLYTNHQELYKLIKDDVIVDKGSNQKFDFNLDLGHSKNFLNLLGLKNAHFTQMQLKGRIDTYKNDLSLAADFPNLKMSDNYFRSVNVLVNTNKGIGDVFISIDSTYAMGRPFNPIDFQSKLIKDTLKFDLSTDKLAKSIEEISIKGDMTPHVKGYRLHLTDKTIVFLGSKWSIQPNNSVIFGKEYVNFSNFNISDGTRIIELDDMNNNKGLNLGLSNFDLSVINSLVKIGQLQFKGHSSVSVNVSNIFSKNKEVIGYLNAPQFSINDVPYGSIFVDAELKGKELKLNTSIGDFMAIRGNYNTETQSIESLIRLRKAPLKIIEYFLKTGIKDTEGYIYGDAIINGSGSDIYMNGQGEVKKGKTTIIYTGVTYGFDKQKFEITDKYIDLTGVELKDENGGIGTVNGRLTHNFFKNFGVNATVSGNNIIALNTTKLDNPDYYGFCVGDISATFTGPFEKLNMNITGSTRIGTKINIPVEDSQEAVDYSFIKFKSKDKNEKRNTSSSINGINLQMALSITPEAEMNIIFDEARGDVIKGSGRGNLNIELNRNGDFQIFGNYDIETGEYLFTAPLLLVAKPFVVQRGGRVQWTGDPVNATLDITAKYRTRTSSLRQFVSEYLLDEFISDPQFFEAVDVEVDLKLGGYLFSPEINFGLKFPNLIGEAANIVDNKMRLLQNNPQEINSQVLGLIVFNSFIPSSDIGNAFGASGIQTAGINTLSEFLASQLSLYITNVVNTIVSDDSFISSINVGLNVRNNNFGLENTSFLPDEVGIRNTIYFKNNRLSVDLGGQFVYQYLGQPINQVLPDFALEFILTEDRKLRVRLYGKADIDISNNGLRQKYGLGLGYRTEFGSMLDFKNTLKTSVKDAIQLNL